MNYLYKELLYLVDICKYGIIINNGQAERSRDTWKHFAWLKTPEAKP